MHGVEAWTFDAFKIAYYALEQCSRILSIMLQLAILNKSNILFLLITNLVYV